MRNEEKKPKASSPPSTLFHLLPPSGTGERGNGGYGQSIALLRRRSFSVTLVPCAVGSLPWDAVLAELIWHGLHIGSSSSRTAPDMGPYHRVHPSGANCSNQGPPRAAAPARSPAPAWSPLHGLQVWPGICSSRGLPHSLHQCRSTCSTMVSSTGCSVEPCSTVVLHGLQGDSLLHHGPHHRPQGTSAPVPGAPLPLLLH